MQEGYIYIVQFGYINSIHCTVADFKLRQSFVMGDNVRRLVLLQIYITSFLPPR